MPLPVPGIVPRESEPTQDEPVLFFGEAASTQTLIWHGQHFEFFYSKECPDTVVAGDKVEAIFVPETQQVWLIGVVA